MPAAANPFTYDRPLPPAELVDRAPELERLIELALAGQSARLGAPRRFGKTTLLGALAEAAWEVHDMVPAMVDFSRVTSVDDVVVRVTRAYERGLDRGALRGLWRSLRRRGGAGAQLGVPGVAAVGAGIGIRPEPQALAALHEALDLPRRVHERTGQRCLVILDEFQDLLTAGDGLDGVLRSHLQHHGEAASYVFAGSAPSLMRALFGDRQRPLFEQARAVDLGPLPAAELADWIEQRLEGAGRPELGEHVDGLVAVSEGHPQRAMLLAHLLFEQPDDPDALDATVAAALHEASDALEQTWRGLTSPQRRLLGAVAAGHARPLAAGALAYTGHGKSTQQKVRDQLVADGHLHRGTDGAVAFVDPLLPRWLRRGPGGGAPGASA
jgi:hypothetical protein